MDIEWAKNGTTGELVVYAMCEVPSNAILAEDFLRIFDGFSIGSNDLTQLTLGLDRDSATVAHLFDERDAAVRSLIAWLFSIIHLARVYSYRARRTGPYASICVGAH